MISQSEQVKIDQITFVVDDPVVTGQQLLDLANKRPADQYLIYQVLQTGHMEGIRPDETIDLRKPGIEKFLTFASDRAFFFTLDGRKFEWAAAAISGRKLKDLAGINDPVTYEVWQEVRGSDDRAIGDRDFVSLESPGTERFFTGKKTTTEG
jgi:Multiubiquitin